MMKIKVRTSSGIAYKATIEANTIEEAAEYLASVSWIKTDDGAVVFTNQINLCKKEK